MTTEIWKTVPGFEPYEVSDFGRVRRNGKIRKCWKMPKSGHHSYKLSINGVYRNIQIGRLVALTFIGPPPSSAHQACHDDGNVDNNVPGNIYWGTPQQNQDDRRRHGTTIDGEKNHQAKITAEQAAEIIALKGTATLKEIGAMFGISYAQVWRIQQRLSWRLDDEAGEAA